MKMIIALLILLIASIIIENGCSSSDYTYNSAGGSETTIRKHLGEGAVDAYFEGKRRWDSMTGQN